MRERANVDFAYCATRSRTGFSTIAHATRGFAENNPRSAHNHKVGQHNCPAMGGG
jgi:hypothetical protein